MAIFEGVEDAHLIQNLLSTVLLNGLDGHVVDGLLLAALVDNGELAPAYFLVNMKVVHFK